MKAEGKTVPLSPFILHPSSFILSPNWYLDRERRAFAGLALDADGAVVLVDGLLGDGEAEPRPRLLRREVGLEDFGEVVGVDADARVGDAHPRQPVLRGEADRQPPAAPLHRVHAVNDKVRKQRT